MDDISSDFRVLYTEDLYQENGMCVPVDIAQSPMRTPERLIWETSKELAIKVDQAWISNQEVLGKIHPYHYYCVEEGFDDCRSSLVLSNSDQVLWCHIESLGRKK